MDWDINCNHIYLSIIKLMNIDRYKILKPQNPGFFKDKGSRFISYAFNIKNEIEVSGCINLIKKKEKNAQHYCYAYILCPNKEIYKFNDDGEPKYSAGKPILGQIKSSNLTNTLIIVVRYFGGIKLGTSGLINAYKSASLDVISKSNILIQIIKSVYEISYNYQYMNDVMRIIKEHKIEILKTDFQVHCKLLFAVEKSKEKEQINNFKKNHNIMINHIKTI